MSSSDDLLLFAVSLFQRKTFCKTEKYSTFAVG